MKTILFACSLLFLVSCFSKSDKNEGPVQKVQSSKEESCDDPAKEEESFEEAKEEKEDVLNLEEGSSGGCKL